MPATLPVHLNIIFYNKVAQSVAPACGDTRNKKTSFNLFPGKCEIERRSDLEITYEVQKI
jgi:hypothetical protein